MKTVDVYFDYACPFCHTGLADLHAVMPEFPEILVAYKACEAWPDPKSQAALAFQGMHGILAQGGNIMPYHAGVFDAFFVHKRRITAEVLTQCAQDCGIDLATFARALEAGTYAAQQIAANDYAYDILHIDAVPTLFCGDRRYDAVLGQGISREGLRAFFRSL